MDKLRFVKSESTMPEGSGLCTSFCPRGGVLLVDACREDRAVTRGACTDGRYLFQCPHTRYIAVLTKSRGEWFTTGLVDFTKPK